MADWHGIQQFEYRWQPAKDFSLIAGSLPAEAIRRWSDQIALWVRHCAVDAPTESVRYEIFDDGMAAFAWRQRNDPGTGFREGTEGRPEISRVLMGPVRLLTPGVAVAVCHTGLPEAIGPAPGVVEVNSPLPPVDPAELTDLARDQAGELDQLVVNEPGLYRVIAAALTYPDSPLSVQLPQRVIAGPPQGGSQGPLLWGLLHTVRPLLGPDPGQRGWSFSTYEPPLGDVGTGAFADIVFRTQQTVQPALSTRREILVRPREPKEPPPPILYLNFASLLVDAYRYLGGEKLFQHLDAVGGDYESLDQRIAGVEATLHALLPPTALLGQSRRSGPVDEPALRQPEEVPPADDLIHAENMALAEDIEWHEEEAAAWQENRTLPESAVPSASPVPTTPYSETAAQQPHLAASPLSPSLPPTAAQPSGTPSWPSRAPASPLGASSRPREHAPPLSPAGSRQKPTSAAPQYTLSSLLDRLSAGPADAGFEQALHYLRTGNFPDKPGDRAAARRKVAERDWFIPVLLQYDSAHFDDTLEAIFNLAVIPDLGRPDVGAELVRWAGEKAAPPPVIKALNAAAQNRAGAPELMRQILEPPLGRRWLADHGIYTEPSAYTAAAASAPRSQGAHAAGGSHSLRTSLEGRLRGDPATLLAVFCAVLIALLVLSLVH